MAESVFEAVKQSITVREAAQMYGIEVNRSGMACCPFHDDKNPSMKLNEEYFYCFGCGATGDVIDFTARLYNLSPKEAAEKLAQDFGLAYDSQAPPRRRHVRQKSEAQKFKEDRDHAFRVLADYFHLLRKWETDYTPKTPEENPHPRFMEAIQKKDYVGYLLDFFLENSPEEQKLWIAEHQSEIAKLERRVKFMADKTTNRERLQEITAGIEQGIKELFESEKYMRYLSVMSKFHRYSVNNTMLIYMQRPDATLVAGFNKWKNQFERHVKKGEHGITIIAPTPFKKKIEEQKLDPDTKAPILDAEGKAVMEEREVEIPMFRPVKVFDVSQTDGKPLPEPVFTPPTQEGVFRGKDLLNDFYAPNGTYYTVAWNKLYRAEVWKLLHYPEGRLHEDDFVAHRLFWRCDKVVCLPDVLYNYRLRSGSIMRTSLKPGAFDAVDGLADRYRFYVENGADRSVIDSAYAACWRRYLFLCAKVRQNPEPQLVKAISKEQFLMQGLISYLPNCRHMKMTEKLSAARWAMMPAESLCPAK